MVGIRGKGEEDMKNHSKICVFQTWMVKNI